ncbi:MAG: family efflux transporter subunit, HlyD family secretion protein [Candidatus Kaiserbacteria bacterium]|nr:family efflux transporter subunit, HlyD family secretion protein [Candidatus Kaiserbacteria bacterium]
MQAHISRIAGLKKYVIAHKVLSGFLAVVILGVGYAGYKHFNPVVVQTRYVLSNVATGTIVAVVSGSGQVSASNQVDIKPKASGDVTAVLVAEGQYVGSGAAIAYIDATDAQKAVRDAQTSLETAQLSLEKLQQPADTLTLTQAQNNLARAQESQQSAQDALPKAYDDAYTQIDSVYQNLPNVVTGLNSIIFGTDRTLGGSGQWNIDYYANSINTQRNSLDANAPRQQVIDGYNAAKSAYDKAAADYQSASRAQSQAATDALLSETINAVTLTSAAVKNASNFIQLYKDTFSAKNVTSSPTADTHITTLSGYISTTNSEQAGVKSSQASIKNAQQAITDAIRSVAESQASLTKTTGGPDSLDLRSAQITVQQRKDALTDAQNTLADYSIRAPFAGTIAKLDLHKGDSVSTGTTAATIITKQDIAELSLNEIDATKVKMGQKVTLTFDAIDGLTVTGEVASIDSLGTVTQGVVSYAVKIGFDTQDARVKPGMTVNADIQTDVRQNVLVVPSGAVKTSNGSSYVQMFTPPLTDTGTGNAGVTTTQIPQSVQVTIGITDGTNTEITAGLAAGDQVVARTTTTSGTATAAATAATSRTGARGPTGGTAVGGIRL